MMSHKNRTFVRRIGQKALTFRIPIIVAGEVSYIHPDTFLGRWVVLSFVAVLEHFEVQLWNRQGKELAQHETALLLAPIKAAVLGWSKPLIQEQAHYTVVCDPLYRLQRLYGGQTAETAGHGRTFVIDPAGSLRFHLTHSLTEQGMAILTKVLLVHQEIAAHGLETISRKRRDLNSSDCPRVSLAI